MKFDLSQRCNEMRAELLAFMDEFIYPNEETFEEQLSSQGTRWHTPQIVDDLKAEARKRGLWNLFLPDEHHGAGLTNVEYAPLCEIMGRVDWAPEVFNCNAPDTGNMEVLHMYGTPAQQDEWLTPLLNGEIRSAFAMTEPDVASSDATNIRCSITRDGDSYVINGRKWWTSNAGNPRCRIMIVMGKTDPSAARHEQQSQILVPSETPGVTIERMLNVMGFDDAPHGHGFENKADALGENFLSILAHIDVADDDRARLTAGDGGVGGILEPVAFLQPVYQTPLKIGDMTSNSFHIRILYRLNDDVIAEPVDADLAHLLRMRKPRRQQARAKGKTKPLHIETP